MQFSVDVDHQIPKHPHPAPVVVTYLQVTYSFEVGAGKIGRHEGITYILYIHHTISISAIILGNIKHS